MGHLERKSESWDRGGAALHAKAGRPTGRRGGTEMRYWLALMVGLASAGAASAAVTPWSIERLNKDGWEIAGYAGTSDIRASLILFRHKDRSFMVQCSTFFDVTRSSHVTLNCYELH